MPELPEVETSRLGLDPLLEHNTLQRVIVRDARLRWPVPAEIGALRDAPVLGWRRRGKYLLLEIAGGTLIVHLGMSGSLRVARPGSPWRRHDHVEWQLAGDRSIRFHDPRRFGCMLWHPAAQAGDHPLLARLGPEPLAAGFGGDWLWRRSRGRRQAVKNFIMDARTVVGIGNIYAAEALFEAAIHPARAAGRVSRQRYDRLACAIRGVLEDAIAMGGTTLRDFTGSNGEPGYFIQNLKVYGRAGRPCRRCGRSITKRHIGQRSSYYCPGCQH